MQLIMLHCFNIDVEKVRGQDEPYPNPKGGKTDLNH